MELGRAMHAEKPRFRLGSRLFSLFVLLPLACLLAVAIGFGPSPYFWLIPAQILVPWTAFLLVWCFPGVVSYDGGWDDKYVAWSVVVLLITLPARIAYYYVALLNETSALLAAFIVSAILCLAAALIESDRLARRDRFVMIFWLLPAMLYSHAAAIQLNCVLDNSPATVCRTVVTKRSLVYGDIYHSDYRLHVEPWARSAELRAQPCRAESTIPCMWAKQSVWCKERVGWE